MIATNVAVSKPRPYKTDLWPLKIDGKALIHVWMGKRRIHKYFGRMYMKSIVIWWILEIRVNKYKYFCAYLLLYWSSVDSRY